MASSAAGHTHALRGLQSRPGCPGQDPCSNFANGWLAYQVSKVNNTDGTCQEKCAAGGTLTKYVENEGFSCGACVKPTCPNQEICQDFGNGELGYSVHQISAESGACGELCASGNALALLFFDGYTCGACPSSCPNQVPCDDDGLAYTIHRPSDSNSSPCLEHCMAGTSLTVLLLSGEFVCGGCP